MGQKLVRFGGLRGTRSRQGASIEVHEAGRIRPSSGCNGMQWGAFPLVDPPVLSVVVSVDCLVFYFVLLFGFLEVNRCGTSRR
jgi:hypothetical protein